MSAVVANGGQIPTYQWYINGNPVPLATQSTFVNSNYSDGDTVMCVVASNGVCGSLTSFNTVVMNIEGNVGVAHVKGKSSNLQLMPNPNKGEFIVKGTLGVTVDEEVTLEVTNMLGQVVYKQKVMSKAGVVNRSVVIPDRAIVHRALAIFYVIKPECNIGMARAIYKGGFRAPVGGGVKRSGTGIVCGTGITNNSGVCPYMQGSTEPEGHSAGCTATACYVPCFFTTHIPPVGSCTFRSICFFQYLQMMGYTWL